MLRILGRRQEMRSLYWMHHCNIFYEDENRELVYKKLTEKLGFTDYCDDCSADA